jgi:hypothetical protein
VIKPAITPNLIANYDYQSAAIVFEIKTKIYTVSLA